MSLANELHSPSKPSSETRKILGPGGNRARVSEHIKPATVVKPTTKQHSSPNEKLLTVVTKNRVLKTPSDAVRKNASVDSFCSSDSSSSSSSSSSLSAVSAKTASSSGRRVRIISGGSRMVSAKAGPASVQTPTTPVDSGSVKRCDWITAHSEPLYVFFHDEEWGVPVHDDARLFELFVLSMALAEHTWVSILSKRDSFRKQFDNFEPSSVAKLSEEKLLSLGSGGSSVLLSEVKLRAVVDNAKQVIKIQEEFGSFSNYCWRFVNNKPARNGYRYSRQVPVKTPKSEVISKDLIRRGFRCVGPTVIYSFMQVCGMVNDHLMSCYRYNECNEKPKKESSKVLMVDDGVVLNGGGMEKMSLSLQD